MSEETSRDRELIRRTNEFLNYIKYMENELQNDKYLYSSFLEICNVLESSIEVIDSKIKRREEMRKQKE